MSSCDGVFSAGLLIMYNHRSSIIKIGFLSTGRDVSHSVNWQKRSNCGVERSDSQADMVD